MIYTKKNQNEAEVVEKFKQVLILCIWSVLLYVGCSFFDFAIASNGGLGTAADKMKGFGDELLTFVRIFSILALVVISGLFAGGFLSKDLFVKFFIGILIVGSAGEIVNFFILDTETQSWWDGGGN